MSGSVPESLDAVTTLGDLSRFHCSQRGEKEAFLYEGRSTSYAEFDRRVNQVANGLLSHPPCFSIFCPAAAAEQALL